MVRYVLTLSILFQGFPFFAQSIINTSFYSQALDTTQQVKVYLPEAYYTNPDLSFPVIYFLHGYLGSVNSANNTIFMADSLIEQGVIEPLIIISANNNTSTFDGSFYVNSSLTWKL